jgi:hypothetical protein
LYGGVGEPDQLSSERGFLLDLQGLREEHRGREKGAQEAGLDTRADRSKRQMYLLRKAESGPVDRMQMYE